MAIAGKLAGADEVIIGLMDPARAREAAPVDVPVAADSKQAHEQTARVVKSITNLRLLYAGLLSQEAIVESVTAPVLNLPRLNRRGSLTTKFVTRKGRP